MTFRLTNGGIKLDLPIFLAQVALPFSFTPAGVSQSALTPNIPDQSAAQKYFHVEVVYVIS